MSPRGMAGLTIVGLLTLTLVGIGGWNEWRRRQVEQIPIGMDKTAVLARLGSPDPPGFPVMGCAKEAAECLAWKLIGQEYVEICFDKAGKVVCHESYSIWY